MRLDLLVTSLAAILNGALLLLLTARVVRMRRKHGVVLGDNDDRAMAKAIRGQANAAEQMPMALILMALAEAQGASLAALGVLAVVFTLGRLLHGAYFGWHGLHWRLRVYGMSLTLLAQAGLLILVAATLIG